MTMDDFNAYFGFLAEPFCKELPAKNLFLTDRLKALFQRLATVLRRRGIVLITGEVGSGKSTAIRAFAEKLDKNQVDFVYVDDPTVGMRGIWGAIADGLNLQAKYFKWQVMSGLKAAIEKNCHDYGKTTVVVIDEAQLLRLSDLEELRLFTNFRIDSHSPLTLILLAQPEFGQKIRLKTLEAFTQRLVLRAHLTGLTEKETHDYVRHQLEVAGRTDALFSDEGVSEVFHQSRGLPRLINSLCYECLMQAYRDKKSVVDMPTLEKVVMALDGG